MRLNKDYNGRMDIDNLAGWPGNFNDNIQTVELRGPDGNCWVQLCEDTNFQGRCITMNKRVKISWPWGSQLSNTMSSVALGHGNAPPSRFRRLEGEYFDEEGEEMDAIPRDPLCEALYEEGFTSNWQMFANSTIKHWEVEKLAKTCETAYGDSEDIDLCKFNVYAGAELLEDEDILKTLEINPRDEDPLSEHEHCALLGDEIFNAIDGGKLSGVAVEQMDGLDYFVLDEPVAASSPLSTVGSLLAMWIGKTWIRAALTL